MDNSKSVRKPSAFNMAAISLGAVMFSSYVGPGFASGTQTVQYFLTKGWIGVFLGVIVCGILSFIVEAIGTEWVRIKRPEHYRQNSDFLYRNKVVRLILGTFKDVLSVFTPIMSVAAQVSAVSLLLNSLWGVPEKVGAYGYCVVVLIMALFGAKILRLTGTGLTIAILGVTLYIAVTGIPNAWGGMKAFLALRQSPAEYGFSTLNAWYIMIIFMGNFLCGSDACVSASRGVILTRKDVLLKAGTNAILCVLSTLVYTIVFAAGMPGITKEALPTLWALQNICGGPKGAQVLYAILAIAAMLSTGIAVTFGVADRWVKPLGKLIPKSSPIVRKAIVAVIILAICLWGSKFGIIAIIYYGFVYMGKVSWPILVLLPTILIPIRIAKDRKAGLLDEDGIYRDAATLEQVAAEQIG